MSRTEITSSAAPTELVALCALIMILVVPSSVAAQEPMADSSTIRAATRTLQSDLRNFAPAQEIYYAEEHTYAPSLPDIAALYRPSPSVTLIVLTGTPRGHSEIAIDERVPGLVCGTFLGEAPPPFGEGEPREVICRGP